MRRPRRANTGKTVRSRSQGRSRRSCATRREPGKGRCWKPRGQTCPGTMRQRRRSRRKKRRTGTKKQKKKLPGRPARPGTRAARTDRQQAAERSRRRSSAKAASRKTAAALPVATSAPIIPMFYMEEILKTTPSPWIRFWVRWAR